MKELLEETAVRAARYLAGIKGRRVAPAPESVAGLESLGGVLPEHSSHPAKVLALLDDAGSPATVATTGPRYFGFVIGGSVPAALAANWLGGAWDQNAALYAMSPVAAKMEEIVLQWLVDLFGLPATCGAGFVTGTTMANFTALAAARSALLKRAGWDVEEDGLFGAPALRVIVGAEVHVSLRKALSLLGLGRSRVTTVPADDQGRMRPEALPPLDDRTIICIQSGNVNTGAFDPLNRFVRAHAKPVPGFTWMALSDCGLPLPRFTRNFSPARAMPTPGQSTATNGSTCPTIPESPWFAILSTCATRWPSAQRTSNPALCGNLVSIPRKHLDEPEESNCGQRCDRSDVAACEN